MLAMLNLWKKPNKYKPMEAKELFIYYLVLNNKNQKFNDSYSLTRALNTWFGLYDSYPISLDLLSKGFIEKEQGVNSKYQMTPKGNAFVKDNYKLYLLDLVERFPDKKAEIEMLNSNLKEGLSN